MRDGVDATDVGVVADEGAVLVPEGVHRATSIGQGTPPGAELGHRFLVRDRHIARRVLARQVGERRGERFGGNVERLVHEGDAGRAQGGVLEAR